MPGRPMVAVLTTIALLTAGCSDTSRSTGPVPGNASRSVAGGSERVVSMHDACDPTSFNAVIGPGTCARNGGVTFQEFIAQLQANGFAGAWHFAPPTMEVAEGQTLLAMNRGGEVHTFTEVEHFGGGIVPSLNQLSGNPVAAPECLKLEDDDFVPPGGSYRDIVHEEGTELYQCCIHPWMRTTVHVHHAS